MTTSSLRALTRLALLFPLVSTLACTDEHEPAEAGELRVGLWGEGASGQTYSLHGSFFFDGYFSISTDELADGTPSLELAMPSGDHSVLLEHGWQVLRGEPGMEQVEVDAVLETDELVEFWIADDLVTNVDYVFEIDGELVPMQWGNVDIDVDFEEDDGVCQPIGASPGTYYSQAGTAVGNSAGWQSFVAPIDFRVTDLGVEWSGLPTDGFTMEVRAGVGPDGMLIGSMAFAAYQSEAPVWLVAPVLGIDLQEGESYTLVAPAAEGWRFSAGALPGAPSDVPNRYRSIIVNGLACD
ncbi:MAG TPA: hypothetical protein VG755_04060 [Nannocystaceae bacterium]|nr:hypothetical protein [Nannocystaceae bacterium]